MKSDEVYLRHILDAADTIEGYLKGVGKDQFMATKLLQDGVMRELEIIGEAVKNVSNDVTRSHPAIPWRDFAGMRDKLIHQYFGVNLDAVWETAAEDVPHLKISLQHVDHSHR